MYRQKIRDHHDHLSRSYRRVADFILSRYFEVSFMTAAQLAFAVGVDTTTVVRFSQRLGYAGYPALLHDIRDQVRAEIYAAYDPQPAPAGDPAAAFAQSVEVERQALTQSVIHNPPEHIVRAVALVSSARRIVVVADGHAEPIALLAAAQLRQHGLDAYAVSDDPARLAGALSALDSTSLVIGISASEHGREVARALQYAHMQGMATLGVVGSLASPLNRISDLVIYAPVAGAGPLPGVVSLAAALSGLVAAYVATTPELSQGHEEAAAAAFAFLIEPESAAPDEPAEPSPAGQGVAE